MRDNVNKCGKYNGETLTTVFNHFKLEASVKLADHATKTSFLAKEHGQAQPKAENRLPQKPSRLTEPRVNRLGRWLN